jgi:deoxyhypusine synthase
MSKYLTQPIEHIDPSRFNAVPLVEGFERMAFQARNLAQAARILDAMVADLDCTVVMTLAGSLISAGLKKTLCMLVETNVVDCIVSTGANMVDMDFFEALGFRHYRGDPKADDRELREHSIDRIYDTYISEDELRVCDSTVTEVADRLTPRPYSSREVTSALGAYLVERGQGQGSLLRTCYEKQVPVFIPSLSDCSAGFGLVYHQANRPQGHITHDSVRDFSELTQLVADSPNSAMVVIGGGVPKNFTADTIVCADVLGKPARMHKYAIQITVADERDGALSGSTLREAHSWGKIEQSAEQMVFCEATLAVPILASYVYHKAAWKNRREKRLAGRFEPVTLLPAATHAATAISSR